MDNLAIGGVAFSVLLSVVLVILGLSTTDSAIIGLVTIVISLILDVLVRQEKNHRSLVKALGLSQEMIADSHLFDSMSSVAKDYKTVVAAVPHRLFVDRAKHGLSECRDIMHDLVEGFMVVPPLSEFSFGLNGLGDVKKSLRATSYVDAERFWNSVAGEKYFQSNVNLANRGVRVTRIFIGDRNTLGRSKEIILRHRSSGIHVLLALSDELPLELCEDYLIADESILVQLELTRPGIARTERLSINPQEVGRAVSRFNRLVAAAHVYEEVFPDHK